MILYAKVENNKIVYEKDDIYNNLLKSLNDKDIQIEIKKRSKKYTVNQNNYFHLVISVFCKDYGWSENDLKLDLKEQFGKKENRVSMVSTNEYYHLFSTTEYEIEDFIILINGTLYWIKHNFPEFKIPDCEIFHLERNDFIQGLL